MHHHVETAELVEGHRYRGRNVGAHGYVGRHAYRAPAPLADLLSDRFAVFGPSGGHDDTEAVGREREGDAAADALAGAGHERGRHSASSLPPSTGSVAPVR